jgi:hypothetical protein
MGTQLMHWLPPPPPFSPSLNRANYNQSYETNYFASLRSYEFLVKRAIQEGRIPVVVFGDSTIRGTGAVGRNVWTSRLEEEVRQADPRIMVINYAQNAGDLLGPFLYYYLRARYPDAYYVLQWSIAKEIGVRHPFHYWLTSEIALRDGNSNPAVKLSFATVPVTTGEERDSFVLAGMNIATNFRDLGNWARYLFFGPLSVNSKRWPMLVPLSQVQESDAEVSKFEPPHDQEMQQLYRTMSLNELNYRHTWLSKPFAERREYLAQAYPPMVRDHLLLFSLDWNPYYAPGNDSSLMSRSQEDWKQLRREMATLDLNWVSLTYALDQVPLDDFADLGHLTPQGQEHLAGVIAPSLLRLLSLKSPVKGKVGLE